MRERNSDSDRGAMRVPLADLQLAALLPDGPSITVKQAAALLSIDISSVYKAVHRGELLGHRVGKRGVRIYLNSVDAYRQARKILPPAPALKPKAHPQRLTADYYRALKELESAGVFYPGEVDRMIKDGTVWEKERGRWG